LANLHLCKAEKDSPEQALKIDSLRFKVLEQDNPFDEHASDSSNSNSKGSKSSSNYIIKDDKSKNSEEKRRNLN
jgi:hypothetical protein